ncbi:MAG TPA: DNA circularization N-terminal domain-containing protein [Rhodopila sp.]|jgi:prophage DNA circulation protein|nr:DNA circularization N-terminal domain-containing protein [Rhodopila sp.]
MAGIGSTIGNVVGGVTGTATGLSRLANGVSDILSGNYAALLSGFGPWANGMQTASWRGLPFAVRESTIQKGRRFAEHVYPHRDDIYEEDMGRGVRRYSFVGFLVGDNVLAESAAMQAAVEQKGTGTLVHPTLGSRTCAVKAFSAKQSAERGRVIELFFTFTESSPTLFPSLVNSTQAGVATQSKGLLATIASDFQNDVAAPLAEGAAAIQSAVSTVGTWAGMAFKLVGDAQMIFGSVLGLVGNFGIFSSGGMTTPQPITATASSLLGASTTNRTAVQTAVTTCETAAGEMTPTSTAAFTTAVAAVAQALQTAATSPRDQIRLLTNLANYFPASVATSAPIGAAMTTVQASVASVCRRTALAVLASSCSSYQPSSSEDAVSLLVSVTDLMDAEIILAADGGDLQSYGALRALRAAVSQDLLQRAAQLASQITVTTPAPQPSLQIAYRLYRDASRSDDLIARAAPVNPAFMPTSFEALSS